MIKQDSWWLKLLRWIQNKLVHTNTVPNKPLEDLNLDLTRPMVYVLKAESISDINVLRNITEKFGFPSPDEPFEIQGQRFPRVVCLTGAKSIFGRRTSNAPFLDTFSRLLSLHQNDPQQDVQLVPVSLFWGRTPGKDDDTMKAAVFEREDPSWLRKSLMILFLGRHNFIQFSNAVSLRYMADEHGTDQSIAHKLARVARVHFRRQRKVMTGPALPNRQGLFYSLLNSENIKRAITEESISKKIPQAEARAKAIEYMDEIAADYSDSLIRICERLLTWLWNKLYRGINIKGAEQIRQLHHDGHEIVYLPCHRSHMDYLLLSYILYFQGMVPPHIAAGINLNFWPAGPMFRRGGAFFIRRSFKGNKLYTAVFREYLDQLFAKGYSVEFFAEGGRSRTGRLLAPKTGMLAMTMNSVLRGIERPVTLVPVYLGYDHVMEVATYHKELSGKKKKKESVWQVFKAIRKLGNFGQGYVNFGEPITLQSFLNNEVPDWREQLSQDPEHKPSWLTPEVNVLSTRVMTNINNAAAVTSVTLSSAMLLAADQNTLERSQLENQLDFCLAMLRQVPYSQYASVVNGDGRALVEQGLELNKLVLKSDGLGQLISISPLHVLSMTYYRNNIIHLLILPALIASCLINIKKSSRKTLLTIIESFYPLLEAELFMGVKDLPDYSIKLLDFYAENEFIEIKGNGQLIVNDEKINMLLLLAGLVNETMQRYAIIFNLLAARPDIERPELEAESHVLAQRLGALHGITAPEFYDKKLYGTLSVRLKELGYLSGEAESVADMRNYANMLLSPSVRRTIVDAVIAEH